MPKPKKKAPVKKKPVRRRATGKLDVEDRLLKDRQVFLDTVVTSESISVLIKKIIVLDTISSDPINMWIHSPGGSCHAGLALIKIMKSVKSPIVTIINNMACSMGAIISVCGDKRLAYDVSSYMLHPMASWSSDYVNFMKDRMINTLRLEETIDKIIADHTKLTKRDFDKFHNGELWLVGDELLQKGIIDGIIK